GKSPGGFPLQGMMSPAATDPHAQQQSQQQIVHQTSLASYQRHQVIPQQGPYGHPPHGHGPSVMTPSSTNDPSDPNCQTRSVASNSPLNQSRVPNPGYYSPFQKHYDQLGK